MKQSNLFAALAGSTAGNVLPITGAAIVVLAALVGSGVDASRGYLVQNRLQNACDAAVLAGRRAVITDGFDDSAEQQARTYFTVNFGESPQGVTDTQFVPTSEDNGNRVDGIATTKLPTAIMKLFGHDTMALTANCSASMSVGNSDVVMVLDTTGSMAGTLAGESQTRLQALRTAMKNFYGTVSGASAGSNARIRFGFVPYSSSVNVGRLLYDLNPDYLTTAHAIQSRVPVYGPETVQEAYWGEPRTSTTTTTGSTTSYAWTRYSGGYSKGDCDRAKPADTAWSNYGSPTTNSSVTESGDTQTTVRTSTQYQVMTAYRCERVSGTYEVQGQIRARPVVTEVREERPRQYRTYTRTVFKNWSYQQVNDLNYAAFRTFAPVTTLTGEAGGQPANVTSTWSGCIEERATVAASTFSYSSVFGISPGSATDLDIDRAPDPWDNRTKWAPMWPQVAYYRTTVSSYYGEHISTASTSQTGRQAQSYCPRPARLLAKMSKSEFDAVADSLNPVGATYHDLGMIWGARLSSPTGIFADNVTAAPENGGAVARHVIFMTDGEMEPSYIVQSSYGVEYHDRRVTDNGYSNQAARHTSRFRAVCEATKAKGIRVWVIAFASALTSDLQACASNGSSFTARNASELNDAFQEIAKDVGELRIVR